MDMTTADSDQADSAKERSSNESKTQPEPVKKQQVDAPKTSTTLVDRFFKKAPTNTGYYGEPGAGDSRFIAIGSVLFFIALWTFVTEAGFIKPLFLPSPVDVMARLVDVYQDGFAGATLAQHLLASTGRIFGSFFLACLVGIPLGIAIGCSRVVRGIFDPLIEFYRPLPPLAYLPLVIIWMGIDESSKIMLIFLAMLAPIVLSTRAGVGSVRIEQIQVAYSMGASRWQVTSQIITRGAMPDILTGMRIAVGFGWTTLVAAEMVAAERGIGFMVLNASEFLVTDVVIAGILVIGLIAFGFDMLMRFAETKLVPWKGQN